MAYNRNEAIEFLVNSHDFEKESVEGMGDNCLRRTYECFNGENEEQSRNSSGIEPLTDAFGDRMLSPSEIEDDVDETITQNAEEWEKENLIDTITSNSQYEAEEIENNSISFLEKMVSNVARTANYSGQISGGSSATSGSEDSNFPALSVNDRISQTESGTQ